jgi:hypothetical protein
MHVSIVRASLRTASIIVLVASVHAGTWHVDDDGGPGIDFTDLPPCIAAASANDVILLGPGFYTGVSIDKPLRILGQDPATTILVDDVNIATVSGPDPIVLVGLSARAIRANNVHCPLIVQNAGVHLVATDASDVRLVNVSTNPGAMLPPLDGALIRSSRAEIVSCSLNGHDPWIFSNADGGHGLWANDASYVHAVASEFVGAFGGDGQSFANRSGNGGNGLFLDGCTQATLISVDATGGAGVCNTGGGKDGEPGVGFLLKNSRAGEFDVHTVGGVGFCYPSSAGFWMLSDGRCAFEQGLFSLAQHAWIEAVGPTAAGSVVHLRVHGTPGDLVTLFIGRRALVASEVGVIGDQLCDRLRSVPLGLIPTQGTIDYALKIPAQLAPGSLIVAQAQVTSTGTTAKSNTNSAPIVVR